MTGFELRTSGIKATALPTEPQPLPLVIVLIRNGGSKWPILKHLERQIINTFFQLCVDDLSNVLPTLSLFNETK